MGHRTIGDPHWDSPVVWQRIRCSFSLALHLGSPPAFPSDGGSALASHLFRLMLKVDLGTSGSASANGQQPTGPRTHHVSRIGPSGMVVRCTRSLPGQARAAVPGRVHEPVPGRRGGQRADRRRDRLRRRAVDRPLRPDPGAGHPDGPDRQRPVPGDRRPVPQYPGPSTSACSAPTGSPPAASSPRPCPPGRPP